MPIMYDSNFPYFFAYICWPCLGRYKVACPCPFIKLCHRDPYEEPAKAEDGDGDNQHDGVDVEEALHGEPA